MRDFSFDPERAAQSQREMVELGVELQQLQLGLIRWCGTQFGEAFVAWMHVKVSERASESERERESVTLLSQETRALSLSDARPLVAFVARRARARGGGVQVIRAFVESVLRYGLPFDFLTVLLLPHRNCEPPLGAALAHMTAHLQGAGFVAADDDDDDDGAEKYSPTVLQKFSISAPSSSA